jgi:hypothetical protein
MDCAGILLNHRAANAYRPRPYVGRDIHDGGTVAIVSENTAHEMWGAPEAALGKRIRATDKDGWREVIGVVADEHADALTRGPP